MWTRGECREVSHRPSMTSSEPRTASVTSSPGHLSLLRVTHSARSLVPHSLTSFVPLRSDDDRREEEQRSGGTEGGRKRVTER